MVIKARALGGGSFTARNLTRGVPGTLDGREFRYATGLQVVSTLSHPYRTLGRSKGDVGGPFQSQKIEVRLGPSSSPQWRRQFLTSGAPAYEYYSMYVPHINVASLIRDLADNGGTTSKAKTYTNSVLPISPGASSLLAAGSTAVSRFSPLNPVADTATTLAEFASERGFFSVPGKAGNPGGEYLNYQFGIAPTISYVKDLREAISRQEQVTYQLARDSGRVVRRRGALPDFDYDESTIVTDTSAHPAYYGTGGSAVSNPGRRTIQTTKTERYWFSGAFTYHLPEEGLMRRVAELDKLYGVKPGVDTAWELMPFSWLLDYKLSLGSALKNVNAFAMDGLVMKYGYVMCTSQEVTDYTWTGKLADAGGSFYEHVLSATVKKTVLQRVPASPFGFGVMPGDLSDRQMSILAALGISYLK